MSSGSTTKNTSAMIVAEVSNSNSGRDLWLGITFMVLATCCYAAMGICTKLALPDTPVTIVVFFRFLFLLLCMLPVLFMQGLPLLKTDTLWLHALRGLVGALGISCTFISIKFLSLATVVLLGSTEPLFVPFIFRITKGVKIIPSLYIGIIIGLIGVGFILRPQYGFFEYATLIALSAGLLRGIGVSALRTLTKTHQTKTVMLYFFFFGTLFTGVSTFSSWHGSAQWAWGWMVGVGVTSFLFQLFLTKAFTHAPARLMSPFGYLAVVFVALADWLLWDQGLTWLTVAGIVLVVTGAVATTVAGRKILVSALLSESSSSSSL